MNLSNQEAILIISSASGAGKTTLIRKLLEAYPQIHFSVSSTTRKPRTNEVHGVDYYFISTELFQEKVNHHDFLEYALVHDNWYGTTRQEVESTLNEGKLCLLDIDIQGYLQIKPILKKATSVFVLPPSLDELKRRLEDRHTETQEQIALRLKNAEKELAQQCHYDHKIINDNLDSAYSQLISVVAPLIEYLPKGPSYANS